MAHPGRRQSPRPRASAARTTFRQNIFCLALFVLAVFRPGVDRLDRWLVGPCWSVPSVWNAVAEAAIQTGVVEPLPNSLTALWRHACVPNPFPPRLAVVTVSDMRHSRITILDESYRVRGRFERLTADPVLVTDEARGFKPLSHLWPIRDWNRDGRLETLVATSPTLSGPLTNGTFAFVALGAEDNEVLFACQLRSGRGKARAILERGDSNNDGLTDLAILPLGTEDPSPLAVFTWNASTESFELVNPPTSGGLASWWYARPGHRLLFAHDRPLDGVLQAVPEVNGDSRVQ